MTVADIEFFKSYSKYGTGEVDRFDLVNGVTGARVALAPYPRDWNLADPEVQKRKFAICMIGDSRERRRARLFLRLFTMQHQKKDASLDAMEVGRRRWVGGLRRIVQELGKVLEEKLWFWGERPRDGRVLGTTTNARSSLAIFFLSLFPQVYSLPEVHALNWTERPEIMRTHLTVTPNNILFSLKKRCPAWRLNIPARGAKNTPQQRLGPTASTSVNHFMILRNAKDSFVDSAPNSQPSSAGVTPTPGFPVGAGFPAAPLPLVPRLSPDIVSNEEIEQFVQRGGSRPKSPMSPVLETKEVKEMIGREGSDRSCFGRSG